FLGFYQIRERKAGTQAEQQRSISCPTVGARVGFYVTCGSTLCVCEQITMLLLRGLCSASINGGDNAHFRRRFAHHATGWPCCGLAGRAACGRWLVWSRPRYRNWICWFFDRPLVAPVIGHSLWQRDDQCDFCCHDRCGGPFSDCCILKKRIPATTPVLALATLRSPQLLFHNH